MSCPHSSQQHWDVATTSGVVRQWQGWLHRFDCDGDDRSRRPDVTAWPCVSTEKTFEGAAGPPSRARRVSCTGEAAQCHEADTGLASQCRTAAGMASSPEVGETAPGRDSQACQSSGAALWRQSIKCLYARAGTGACGGVGKARVGALERSGPRPRGCSALERGGPRSRGEAEPSSEADPVGHTPRVLMQGRKKSRRRTPTIIPLYSY
jgi:hypothetical protein